MVLRDTKEPILDKTASTHHTRDLSCDTTGTGCNAASFRIRRRKVTRSTAAHSCNYCSGWPDALGQSAAARWSSDDFHTSPGFQMNPDACPLECLCWVSSCPARLGAECNPPVDAARS